MLPEILNENRNIRVLVLQATLTQLSFGMLMVVWQPYAVKLGTSYTQLGTIQAVVTIASAMGSLFWGRFSDRYGRKPAYIGIMLTRILAILSMYTATNWSGLLVFGFFIGFTASWNQSSPVASTLLTESVAENHMNIALSLYSSAGTLIAVLASPVGGVLAVSSQYKIIFLSCILGELLNILFTRIFLTETLMHDESNVNVLDIRSLLLPERELLPFYIMSVLTMFGWRIAFSNLNAILVYSYDISTVQLGLMVSVFSISYGLTQTPIGGILDKYPKRQFLILSRIGFLVIAIGYILSKSFAMLVFVQFVNGVSHSFGVPALTSMVVMSTPKEERATALAKLATLPQVVSIPAPIIGAYLYEVYGFNTTLYIRAFLLILSIFVAVFWIKYEN